jgi:hypothetical protein
MSGYPTGEYLFYRNDDRNQELNQRISARNQSDGPLEPQFSPRPVFTKYAHFPIVDMRTAPKEPLTRYPTYDPSRQFNPGDRGPTTGYLNNINTESQLRLQPIARQASIQDMYIPSSGGTLYSTARPVEQPTSLGFVRSQWADTTGAFIDEFPQVGGALLNNATRAQIKDIPDGGGYI